MSNPGLRAAHAVSPSWAGSQATHMRALTWPRMKQLGWLLPPPPALNVTKPSCCFQHMFPGRRRREEAGCQVKLPKAPRKVKGRHTGRQRGGRRGAADRASAPSAQPATPGGVSPCTYPPTRPRASHCSTTSSALQGNARRWTCLSFLPTLLSAFPLFPPPLPFSPHAWEMFSLAPFLFQSEASHQK